MKIKMNKCRKCGKMLPDNAKGKLCENCRNQRNQAVLNAAKGLAGLAISAVPIALGIKRHKG